VRSKVKKLALRVVSLRRNYDDEMELAVRGTVSGMHAGNAEDREIQGQEAGPPCGLPAQELRRRDFLRACQDWRSSVIHEVSDDDAELVFQFTQEEVEKDGV
jgi:hypothetical protein